jgi:hypothetical protein
MDLPKLWDEFSKRANLEHYRDRIEKERKSQPGAADYFDEVFVAYRVPVDDRQYSLAIDRGLSLFENYKQSAPDFDDQHKGSPFYVMGYAAFASHDYATASLMFDAAVAEDLDYWGADKATSKPALLFLRLMNENQHVLAGEIIPEIVGAVETLLREYDGRSGAAPLTLDELRTHFLDRFINSPDEHKRTVVTAFISFVAEWKYRSRLVALIPRGSREPFFLHLLRGCVLLESILKESPVMLKNPGTLEKAIKKASAKMGLSPGMKLSAPSFDKSVLQQIEPGMSAGQAVEYAAKCRNTLGHSFVWETPSLSKEKYDLLVGIIASACIHAISTTYR